MSQYTGSYVILRGPSGSGKSSVAEIIARQTEHVAIIEQDYIAENVYRHGPDFKEATKNTIAAVAAVAEQYQHKILIEGILNTAIYQDYFKMLRSKHRDKVLFVYLDVSFEATLARHAGRGKARLFSKGEMAAWFAKSSPLGVSDELIILEDMSAEEAAVKIIEAAQW